MNGRGFVKTNKQTPSQGLDILEDLYKKFPENQKIRENLINSYIKYGNYQIAKKMITYSKKIPLKKLAWLSYKEKNLEFTKNIWKKVIKEDYFPALDYLDNHLIKIDKKNINIQEKDIVLFTHIYNEMNRLPFFLEHYRKLGISKFIIIDNNSTDNCQEFLLSQSDVHIFWTNSCHLQSSSGMSWIKSLKDKYIPENSWYLVVDADEFLVYPNYEQKPLNILIDYMEENTYQALPSFMLDMYAKTIKEQLTIQPTDNFIKASPFFYNYYRFIDNIIPPFFDVYGGIFYKLSNQMIRLVKVPLVKNTKDLHYIMGNHNTTPVNFSDITSCLLHFKFIGDFQSNSKMMVQEKRHYAGSIMYKHYQDIFNNQEINEFDFSKLDKSIYYENSIQLVELKLLKNPKNF